MKHIRLIPALLCTCLLAGCTAGNIPESPTPPGTESVMPAVDVPETSRVAEDVILYFRYMDDAYLAAEERTLTQLPSQAWEQVLITALINGPETQSTRLNPLFPEGTRLVTTARDGRTLFVTLSHHLLNRYPDEPSAWRDSPYWSVEVPLRRQLCMQSIVATVTENSDVDQVQFLVAQDNADGVSRLMQNYFTPDAPAIPAPLQSRNTALLLTPDNTVQAVLTAWTTQDWDALYSYVQQSDGITAPSAMDYRAFTSHMTALPQLTAYTASTGSISADGQQATYAVSAALLMPDGITADACGTLRLVRRNGLWCITMDELTGWMED